MDTRRVVALAALVVLAGCTAAPAGVPGVGGPADSAATDAASETTAAPGATTAPGTTASPDDSATGGESPGTAPGTTAMARQPGVPVTVEAVASADTLVVRRGNGSLDRVRLAGVDAPPVHRRADPTGYDGVPHSRPGERCLEAVGQGAHDRLAARLEGASVGVNPARTGPTRDAAGRLLGTVVHAGERIDRLLVEDGLARVTDRKLPDRPALLALQATAQAENAGVWRCSGIARRFGSNTTLSVVEVSPDAGGPASDDDYLADEFVALRNTGSRAVQLRGWSVYDADDDLDYDFPDGFALSPGQSVTLHTGDGIDAGGHLYWGLEREAWDDDGDVIYVRRPDGSVALRYGYGNGTGA